MSINGQAAYSKYIISVLTLLPNYLSMTSRDAFGKITSVLRYSISSLSAISVSVVLFLS